MKAHRDLAGEPAPPAENSRRGRFWWAKWVLGVALLALLIGEGAYLYPRLHDSWKNLTEIHWGWVVACIVMQAISMSGYGRIQKQLLHAGGVDVSQRKSVSVVYGSTGMALTLPAGQVFSTAFTYRQTRRWGASPIVASWQLVMSGVVAAAGLALLGVFGAMLAGDRIGPVKVVLSLGAVALLVWAGNYVSAHPGAIEGALRRILRLVNRIRHRPVDDGMDKVAEVLDQLESVDLGKRDGAWVALWAIVHRLADVACLGAACYAVGADPRLTGLMLAFAAGKAVGTIPFAPGGIVYVDATLWASLATFAGLPFSQAVAAAFVYRLVSFILVAIVGWIVFLFLYRKPQADDAEYEKEFEELRTAPPLSDTRRPNPPAAQDNPGPSPAV
ncbi:lysylphosphatidylglycerol synthase transmembrane domain-containing protein [Nocardia huaxiensis]|uniref:lysylphosphatidylglycerol synthase transmembrane domain-containing protein n=1 Tax=Nocardia huaxiensis TaxID=2755382 RepID=UPI001E646B69|nr:lysylphosphatidylglycerol synthase transmembrane domain-containing protein [Nocardia huaxiensis]UFS94408.1 flippase-like domain-containing protein [Nocardia huaxiensis]